MACPFDLTPPSLILPTYTVGTPYSADIVASNGVPPYIFNIPPPFNWDGVPPLLNGLTWSNVTTVDPGDTLRIQGTPLDWQLLVSSQDTINPNNSIWNRNLMGTDKFIFRDTPVLGCCAGAPNVGIFQNFTVPRVPQQNIIRIDPDVPGTSVFVVVQGDMTSGAFALVAGSDTQIWKNDASQDIIYTVLTGTNFSIGETITNGIGGIGVVTAIISPTEIIVKITSSPISNELVATGDGITSNFSGILSSFPVKRGSLSISDEEIITLEAIASGDGSTLAFSGTITPPFFPIDNSSDFTITDGVESFTNPNLDGNLISSITLAVAGSINFNTGAWNVTFQNPPANIPNNIRASYRVGLTFQDNGSGLLLTTTNAITNISGEIIAVGDGTTQTFNGTLVYPVIGTNTLSITDGVETFTDNGNGGLISNLTSFQEGNIDYITGIWNVFFQSAPANLQNITANYNSLISGTIDYITGAWSVKFPPALTPPLGKQILANYISGDSFSIGNTITGPFATATIDSIDGSYNTNNGTSKLIGTVTYAGTSIVGEPIASGDGVTIFFSGTLSTPPVKPTTVVITDGTETFTDNGGGILTGNLGGTGTINYLTGEWSVTFSLANPPSAGVNNITADYTGADETLIQWLEDFGTQTIGDGFFYYKFDFFGAQTPWNVYGIDDSAAYIQSYLNGSRNPLWIPFIQFKVYYTVPTEIVTLRNISGAGFIVGEAVSQGSVFGKVLSISGSDMTIELTQRRIFNAIDSATGEFLATGNGILLSFDGFISHVPILTSSLSITDGVETFTDDGAGNLISSITSLPAGTINYTTGEYVITFQNPPTTNITADYLFGNNGNITGSQSGTTAVITTGTVNQDALDWTMPVIVEEGIGSWCSGCTFRHNFLLFNAFAQRFSSSSTTQLIGLTSYDVHSRNLQFEVSDSAFCNIPLQDAFISAILPCDPGHIINSNTPNDPILPDGTMGQAYTPVTFTTSGGTAPFTYIIYSGAIPPGMTFSGDTLSGTPSSLGTFTFTIQSRDSIDCTCDCKDFTITIVSPNPSPSPSPRKRRGGFGGAVPMTTPPLTICMDKTDQRYPTIKYMGYIYENPVDNRNKWCYTLSKRYRTE